MARKWAPPPNRRLIVSARRAKHRQNLPPQDGAACVYDPAQGRPWTMAVVQNGKAVRASHE